MNNAKSYPCPVLYNPASSKYWESVRVFQGPPTIAVTKGGRIFAGWYTGGPQEPHMRNYSILVYSDDGGRTWSRPLLVIPGSYEKCIHNTDISVFVDPNGTLHVLWVQDHAEPTPEDRPTAKPGQPLCFVDGYMFDDYEHSQWEILCEDPDAETLSFTEPRYLYQGLLRTKPTFLDNGDWIYFAYDQIDDRYGYYISSDAGKTFTHYYSAKKLPTEFDEVTAFKRNDGTLKMFARCELGELAQSISYDNGKTWCEATLSGIASANSCYAVQKLPSGRVVLILNNHRKLRDRMTVLLSEDDGNTWTYKKCIDSNGLVFCPSADYHDGKILLTYCRRSALCEEIMFASFTEQDIIDGNDVELITISKSPAHPQKDRIIQAIEENKIIAVLRGVASEKLIPLAEALYDGGIRLLEVAYGSDDSEAARNIALLTKHFGSRMCIGAGTVLTEEQVRLTKDAGGAFIISPNLNARIIAEGFCCGLVTIPGALTPTEIATAHTLGADFVKVFPVSSVGPAYLKAIAAPLSHIKLLAFGGVDADSMQEYLSSGVRGFGICAGILDEELIAQNNYQAITDLAKKYTSAL